MVYLLIQPNSLLSDSCSSVPSFVVSLPSVLTSRLATPVSSTGQALPLALLQDVTPVHRGLSPFGLFKSMNYIYHSRHTHCISVMRAELLKLSIFAPKKLFGGQTVNRSETRTTLILDRWRQFSVRPLKQKKLHNYTEKIKLRICIFTNFW